MSILETKNLTKIYGKNNGMALKALDSFNITLEQGEFVGVMGPSGSGKTTLLNMLATIDTPSSGDILINGTNPKDLNERQISIFRRRELGFIFQDFNMLDTLNVKENIMLPMVIDNKRRSCIEHRVLEVSRLLNIEDILNKKICQISGGQQQRAACARALVNSPSIILADEPTGNLDSKASCDVMNSLTKLNIREGRTILMVTHDPFAASFCRRIVVIKDGKLFLELKREQDRKAFFREILNTLSVLGGNNSEVL